MAIFRDILAHCGLHDAGYSSAWFTWERGYLPVSNIRERLDRAVITDSWFECFPSTQVRHLVHSYSDHCQLLIVTDQIRSYHPVRKFRFEKW